LWPPIRHLCPSKEESGSLEFVGAVTDTTERKRSEEALQKAQAELAHVTRVATLGELTASIAHEINQPLAAVVNNASACVRWLRLRTWKRPGNLPLW
jgi:C4-dicarboxylate-specific signal transduction histidine kinase